MSPRRPVLVAFVLGVGSLAVLYNVRTYSRLFTPPKPHAMASVTEKKAGSASAEGSVDADAVLEPLAEPQLRAYLGRLVPTARDPFRFGGGGSQSGDGAGQPQALPVVQGILLGQTRRVAWINGRARSEGDEVDGHVLRRIDADRVIVERGGRQYELSPAR